LELRALLATPITEDELDNRMRALTTTDEFEHMFIDYDCNRDNILSKGEYELAGMCPQKILNMTLNYHPDLLQMEEAGEAGLDRELGLNEENNVSIVFIVLIKQTELEKELGS